MAASHYSSIYSRDTVSAKARRVAHIVQEEMEALQAARGHLPEAAAATDVERAALICAVLESEELLPRILAYLPKSGHLGLVGPSGRGGRPGSLRKHCCLVCCAHINRHFLQSSEQVYRELLLGSAAPEGCLGRLSWRRQYRIRSRPPARPKSIPSFNWFAQSYHFQAEIRRHSDDPPHRRFLCTAAVRMQGSDSPVRGRAGGPPLVLWLQPLCDLQMAMTVTDATAAGRTQWDPDDSDLPEDKYEPAQGDGWEPGEDHLIVQLFVTHVPTGSTANLGDISLQVNPTWVAGHSTSGCSFRRQEEDAENEHGPQPDAVPPAPKRYAASEYPPSFVRQAEQGREAIGRRPIISFSPSIDPLVFDPEVEYPDDRPDVSQTVGWNGDLWPIPEHIEPLEDPPMPVSAAIASSASPTMCPIECTDFSCVAGAYTPSVDIRWSIRVCTAGQRDLRRAPGI